MVEELVLQGAGLSGGREVTWAHLDSGRGAVGHQVALLAGGAVGLGQQTRVRLGAVLWLHQLQEDTRVTTNDSGGKG